MRQKAVITGLATAVAFLILQTLVHRFLMAELYRATSGVWRAAAVYERLWPVWVLGNLLFGFFFGVIYTKGYESSKESAGQGFRYGAIMAMLFAPAKAMIGYVFLPIPYEIAFCWFFYGSAELLLLGMLAARVFEPLKYS